MSCFFVTSLATQRFFIHLGLCYVACFLRPLELTTVMLHLHLRQCLQLKKVLQLCCRLSWLLYRALLFLGFFSTSSPGPLCCAYGVAASLSSLRLCGVYAVGGSSTCMSTVGLVFCPSCPSWCCLSCSFRSSLLPLSLSLCLSRWKTIQCNSIDLGRTSIASGRVRDGNPGLYAVGFGMLYLLFG